MANLIRPLPRGSDVVYSAGVFYVLTSTAQKDARRFFLSFLVLAGGLALYDVAMLYSLNRDPAQPSLAAVRIVVVAIGTLSLPGI